MRWTIVTLALVACSPDELRVFPPAESFAGYVLGIEHAAGSLEVYAIDGTAGTGPRFSIARPEDGARLVLLAYALPIAHVGLAAGPIARATELDHAVPLPTAQRIFTRGIGDSDWTQLDAPPASIAAFAIATFDPLPCIEAGGCRNGNDPLCVVPCPPPSTPARPDPPHPPEPASCAGEDFPDPNGRAAMFVRPGAMLGGDGSRARPFATIGEAMRAGASLIAVRRGTIEETLFIDRSVEIIGACADQTTIRFGSNVPPIVDVVAGTSTITGLAIEGLSDDTFGTAVHVRNGGRLAIDHAKITYSGTHLAVAEGEGSRLVLRDLLGTATSTSQRIAIYTSTAAHAVVERAVIAGTPIDGIVVAHNASVTLRDVSLLGVKESGFYAITAGMMTIERARIGDAYNTLNALTSGSIRASDFECGGARASCLRAVGATILVERAIFGPSHLVNAIAYERARVELTDVDITGGGHCDGAACDAGCVQGGFESTLAMTRFVARDGADFGTFADSYGQLDLSDGFITGSKVGTRVWRFDYDLARVLDRVAYGDVEKKIRFDIPE